LLLLLPPEVVVVVVVVSALCLDPRVVLAVEVAAVIGLLEA
jgi:hypothetical protein